MDITSISINTSDGNSYYVPISTKADKSPLGAVVKDVLLKHLLYKYNSAPKQPTHEVENLSVQVVSSNCDVFDGCSVEVMMLIGCAREHPVAKIPLARGSSRYRLHLATIKFFYEMGNKWISKRALSANLSHEKKIGLAQNTIKTYLGEMVDYGLLQDVSEADSTKSLRLSPLFINQAKQIGAKK